MVKATPNSLATLMHDENVFMHNNVIDKKLMPSEGFDFSRPLLSATDVFMSPYQRMDLRVQCTGTRTPSSTPLTAINPSIELKRCYNAYTKSVLDYERYSARITSRDIQRDCEHKSSSMFEFNIWKVAKGLNKTAIKEAIMCMIPLAAEVATGKNLPFEISELLHEMIFSSEDWISHQLGNDSRNECGHLFLSSTTESGQVSIDDIRGRQLEIAQSSQNEHKDVPGSRSEDETHLVSRSSSTMLETDFMEDARDLVDSDRSESTPQSDYKNFKIDSESLNLFFKTEIEISI